ncbi:MAG: hypothetical protein OQJ97_15225 [Rhodospirillales bacterium]|nr:hypothetical protein [Rhodospirillales bacterium]
MPVPKIQKNSFTGGEIMPQMLGRGDLTAYVNGAAKLRNVVLHPTGGLSRRPGLRYVDTILGTGRLVSFEFNTEQVYLLVFTNLRMDVYKDGVNVANIVTPWTEAQLSQINWTQSADTLLVVHPDVQPRKITRTSHVDWSITEWVFLNEEIVSGSPEVIRQPYYKYAKDDIKLNYSLTTGTTTLTATADVFVNEHIGTRFRISKKEVEITAVASPTSATATVIETLADGETIDWEEQSFSELRGWPVAVCFHQDRLVIGGSRDLPNRLWMSKSADLFNFDLGEGLDDESIEFSILSDQVNAIRAVFSGRHLQVFTSGAEWMVSGDPLTPENVQLHRQTRIGSPVDRTNPPQDVDGATLFAGRAGNELREFLFTDMEQAYQSKDLALLSKHLITGPVDQDYNNKIRLFYMVTADGHLATLTIYRSEQVTAWTRSETDGTFLSVAIAGGETYFLIERAGVIHLETFDDNAGVDAALIGEEEIATDVWSGLGHLEGRTVKVVADGALHADVTVSSGAITLDRPAKNVVVGLAYTHIVEPLPPANTGQGQGSKVRLVSATFRMLDTSSLRLNTGLGYRQITFRRFGVDAFGDAPQTFSGDKKVRGLGWQQEGVDPLWRIEQDTPLPFNLLSVTEEIKSSL